MWDFRDNQDAQRIIREVYESDGIVSAVCHGPAALGAERNASVAQIAIAWAIVKGTLPLVGATKVHHVLDAACASDIQLRDEEIILLEQLAAETRVDTRGAWEKPMV